MLFSSGESSEMGCGGWGEGEGGGDGKKRKKVKIFKFSGKWNWEKQNFPFSFPAYISLVITILQLRALKYACFCRRRFQMEKKQ